MLELRNFSKNYKDFTAAKNIDLICPDQKITGLIGPNGAGKTTIIKALCSIHFPSDGTAVVTDFEGKQYNCADQICKTRNLIGYVPEVLDLPKKLTVFEYLKQQAQIHSVSDNEILSKLKELLVSLDLEQVKTKKIGNLSKGFKQRVCLAGALIYSPDNLILDEPVNGLDPAQIIQFRKIIQKTSKKCAVLISTHLMQEVEALCDQVYIINKGQILAKGQIQELIESTQSKTMEEAFLKIAGIEYEN